MLVKKWTRAAKQFTDVRTGQGAASEKWVCFRGPVLKKNHSLLLQNDYDIIAAEQERHAAAKRDLQSQEYVNLMSAASTTSSESPRKVQILHAGQVPIPICIQLLGARVSHYHPLFPCRSEQNWRRAELQHSQARQPLLLRPLQLRVPRGHRLPLRAPRRLHTTRRSVGARPAFVSPSARKRRALQLPRRRECTPKSFASRTCVCSTCASTWPILNWLLETMKYEGRKGVSDLLLCSSFSHAKDLGCVGDIPVRLITDALTDLTPK